jgi:hypothetical protein
MSLKSRVVMLAGTLAAVGAMSVASTSAASAATICETEAAAGKLPAGTVFCESIENFEVSGTLGIKKLNQTVELKEGTFNGYVAFSSFAPITGVVSGVTAAKPFETTLKIFGLSSKVGVTFEQVGTVKGSLDQIAPEGSPNCELNPAAPCVTESVPTEANLGFTSITVLGLKIPLECKTSKPVKLPLSENLRLFEELLNPEVGSHFVGTTTYPSISCKGLLGLIEGGLLTSLVSGPNNSYSLFIKA